MINSDLTFTADPSFDPSTMSVFDALASGKDLLYEVDSDGATLKCIYWYKGTDEMVSKIGFRNPTGGKDIALTWTLASDGTVSIEDASPIVQ